ncbi:MAG TPA: preprotein translocase subunit YajC [Thiomonas arsenitoxydans]|jgi:preprotein translocase subunit YajC|uniref:preprotein translocase subunit YajC n=1 Tax=unclassified Thiomonas TaxID=2625466 RepID=UPI000BDA0EA7|nr:MULTISPECIES: preprotein translocase subunit YajC [unclassified Thiomonas]MDE2174057.1 preprotein translocase subunit YajC [Betaproteobacteria bacterium]OYV30409.1 MAG: preprotein translocase subunit YajC [Thiomonas sp. 20-64-9]OZB55276.1 MAG: preprotein translocase subunit YajC [Thiomonas sp. 15-63-373]HOI65899.1 preprotein translocase subunit YajC [Thiomonas arsenitoxydans]OZB69503.1 MAG: preprotein translocase subunit YajC [Thiomonas sp. 13-64-67]
MNLISVAHAQAAAPAPSAGSTLMSLLPIIVMFVILYFVMLRPQMKKQKELRAMLAALAKGDEVVTTGGVVGKISKINDNYVTLEIAANTEVLLQRNAVTMVLPKGTIKSGI